MNGKGICPLFGAPLFAAGKRDEAVKATCEGMRKICAFWTAYKDPREGGPTGHCDLLSDSMVSAAIRKLGQQVGRGGTSPRDVVQGPVDAQDVPF